MIKNAVKKMILFALGLAMAAAPLLAGSAAMAEKEPAWKAFNGKRLGILTGTNMEAATLENFPDSEYLYFNGVPDCNTALLAGRIDGYLGDEPSLKSVHAEEPRISYIPEKLSFNEYNFSFRKNDPKSDALREELNGWLKDSWADGTMQDIEDIWFGADEARKIVDMSDLTGENGTVTAITTSTDMPFSYIKNGKNVGYDIDVAYRFCKARGYKLQLFDCDFAARIPALQSGKGDFICTMNVTEERKEQVNFSGLVCSGGMMLAVRTEDLPAAPTPTSLRWQDYNGRKMGIITGTNFESFTLEHFPNSEHLYYNGSIDAATALISGKIDGFLNDEPTVRVMCQELPAISYLPDLLTHEDYAFGFGKTGARADLLRSQFNEMLADITADGTLSALCDKWFGGDENAKTVDLTGFSGENGTVNVAISATIVPFSYVKDNQYTGLCLELTGMFCRRFGYTPVIEDVAVATIIPGLITGKYDLCASSMGVTEERKESISFSDAFYHSGVVLAVRTEDVQDKQAPASDDFFARLDDLNGKRIGVQTGSSFDAMVQERLPQAELSYYNTKPDLVSALTSNKIDGFVVDEPVIRAQIRQIGGLTYVPEALDAFDFAFVFARDEKGERLRGQISEYLRKIKADGTLQAIEDKWLGSDEQQKTVQDCSTLPATNGTLRMATEALYEPFGYIANNQIVGYEIDLAIRFCQAYGYGLEIEDMSFDAVLPSVQTGKCDFGGAGITITPERAESVLFSESSFSGKTVMVVRDEAAGLDKEKDTLLLRDFNGKRAGVITGSFHDTVIAEEFPQSSISHYGAYPDLIAALKSDKIDYFLASTDVAASLKASEPALVTFDQPVRVIDIGAMFARNERGETLRTQMNAFIEKAKADGTMDAIQTYWSDPAHESTPVDLSELTGENGVLKFATSGTKTPISFVANGRIAGADPDIAARFCREYGYDMEVHIVDTAGIIPGIVTGTYDFSLSDMVITEERKESVNFSAPYRGSNLLVMTLSKEQQASLFSDLKASFEKTFLREERWRLFADGILTTLLITVLSCLLGTFLGFLLFMLCRNGNVLANGVTRFCLWLVQGMPMVVLLMILYYIVFGSVAISGIAVAVIGFTLTFGAAVFGMIKMGVGMIDRGQYEAAYALGHTNRHTFFRIILPQAIPHVLPAYQGEIVGLIKATAIVGYIAVQDLTKMGDIVRSRTYEAFFPLIAVTVIYFVLEGLFSFLVSRIRVSIDPKKRHRAQILKGVNTHD